MKYVYIIKSFDTQAWIETPNIIAFNRDSEARKYCRLNSRLTDVIYTWDKVIIGKMKPPFPKKPKDIVLI